MSENSHYDAIRYPSTVFSTFRPEYMAAAAILHGVVPERINNCRFLEVGCGDGVSLLAMAASLPDAEFVGIDLSEPRIDEAQQSARAIGVSNVRFHCLDVTNFDSKEFGKFDYIAAHGLYSWVPETVRERILVIYKDCLTPKGIGYISYNTFPGWHLRNLIRDAGRFIIGNERQSLEDAEKAIQFVRMMAESPGTGNFYKEIIKSELATAETKAPGILFHDELAELNRPFYISEMVSRFERAGLVFLAEADPTMHLTDPLGPTVNAFLNSLADIPVRREQCLDFLRGTRFRSTLICHSEAAPKYFADAEGMESLYFSSISRPLDPRSDLTDESAVEFLTKEQSKFATNFAFTKSFLAHLGGIYPGSISFMEAEAILRERFPQEEGFIEKLELFKKHVISLYHAGVVEITGFRPHFAKTVSERPKASPFAKWQAATGYPFVTTLQGNNVQFESGLAAEILAQLDGTRPVPEITGALASPANSHLLDELGPETTVADFVERSLDQFCKFGLLID